MRWESIGRFGADKCCDPTSILRGSLASALRIGCRKVLGNEGHESVLSFRERGRD